MRESTLSRLIELSDIYQTEKKEAKRLEQIRVESQQAQAKVDRAAEGKND